MKYYRLINIEGQFAYLSGYNFQTLFGVVVEYAAVVSEPFANSLMVNDTYKEVAEKSEEEIIYLFRENGIEVQISETEFEWIESGDDYKGTVSVPEFDGEEIGEHHFEVYRTHEDGSTESVESFDELHDAVQFKIDSTEALQIDLWVNGKVYMTIDIGDDEYLSDLDELLLNDQTISQEFREVIMESAWLGNEDEEFEEE